MSMHQQEVKRQLRIANQNKDLLLAVRAKAFELQTALSDLVEFGRDEEARALYTTWMQMTDNIYNQSGGEIKGA